MTSVRAAQAIDDAQVISEIARALALPSWSPTAIASWLTSPSGFGAMATRAEAYGVDVAATEPLPTERVLGFVLGSVVLDEACLVLLAVASAFQRQGIGRILLGDFEARARERGATSAYLEVAADNDAARCLYEAHGYQAEAVRPRYYADGRDALVLRRNFGPTTIAR
ncbi:MAG: GNAT family N-acetyltransferase [Deltaproteobacteria bacterium]|nr:GNAT family N-acetyltransferase [Deltaproteobacteria bacterium]